MGVSARLRFGRYQGESGRRADIAFLWRMTSLASNECITASSFLNITLASPVLEQ
jgi:hypothetical protein